MANSIVRVYDTHSGKWAAGKKVVLEWDGMVNLGMSQPVYTDAEGQAIVHHTAVGEAEIYVGGSLRGKMKTPGVKMVEV